jgi:hypothetical protein
MPEHAEEFRVKRTLVAFRHRLIVGDAEEPQSQKPYFVSPEEGRL